MVRDIESYRFGRPALGTDGIDERLSPIRMTVSMSNHMQAHRGEFTANRRPNRSAGAGD
jgi:hypothetical protein